MPVANPLGKQRAKLMAVEVCRPFEIERNGKKIVMTRADLAQSCANYDPDFLLSTLAPDHADSGPTPGFAEKYFMDGDRMMAQVEGDAEVVLEMRRGGNYPHRSLKFSRKEGKEGWYPEHIGLLGVKPPQIKGMKYVDASEIVMLSEAGDAETMTFFLLDGAASSEEDSMPTDKATPQTVELAEYEKVTLELAELRKERDDAKQEAATAKQQAVELAEKQKASEIVLFELRDQSYRDKAEKTIAALDNGQNMTGPTRELLTVMLAAATLGKDEILLSEPGCDPRKLTLAEGVVELAKLLPDHMERPANRKVAESQHTDSIKLSEGQIVLMEAEGLRQGTEAWKKREEMILAETRKYSAKREG